MRPITVEGNQNGLLLLPKKTGETSFQALYPVKKLYGASVGHSGTLDKFAEGLLVVLVGRFTKLNSLLTGLDKVYEADFTFGRETSTLDPEGETVLSGKLPPDKKLLELADGFIGPLQQVPPDFSAVHLDGKRAYERKRAGEEVVLAPRAVEIFQLDVLEWRSPVLTLRIHCSKGTYIRSIARDWGRAAGSGAYVSRLKRWSVGPFQLPHETVFLPPKEALQAMNIPCLEADNSGAILQGKSVSSYVPHLQDIRSDTAGNFSDAGVFLAVAKKEADRWTYLVVNPPP